MDNPDNHNTNDKMNDKNSDDDILQDIDIDIPYINNNTNKHNGNERDSIEIAIESQPISTTTACKSKCTINFNK
jgi:hypothetical protein